MANTNQIKSLLKAHFNNELEKFKVISLQIAAHEAKIGHTSIAREIKGIVESSKKNKNNIIKFNNENAIDIKYSSENLNELVVNEELKNKIKRVLNEYKKRNLLLKHGLKNRSKLLLEGEPGTGKTMTASVVANELKLPLYKVRLEQLISKYMGETSAKLKKIFNRIYENPGVYLFDEFDAIGSDRNYDNDVGEMRRILNSFLQFIEEDESSSIIIAATNNPRALDKALFRRFDDVFEYVLPNSEEIFNLIKINLKEKASLEVLSNEVIMAAKGLNHADIVYACNESLKESLLMNILVDKEVLVKFLDDRKRIKKYKEAK